MNFGTVNVINYLTKKNNKTLSHVQRNGSME